MTDIPKRAIEAAQDAANIARLNYDGVSGLDKTVAIETVRAALTALATPTPEELEAMAKAAWEHNTHVGVWESCNPLTKLHLMDEQRSALRARFAAWGIDQ